MRFDIRFQCSVFSVQENAEPVKVDDVVKRLETASGVIPANAVIQLFTIPSRLFAG
jgi:hypothetical protein